MTSVLNYKGTSSIITSVLDFAWITQFIETDFIIIVNAINPKDINPGIFFKHSKCVRYHEIEYSVPHFTFDKRYCDYYLREDLNVIVGVPYEVVIIQRAWRKWFLKNVRLRNDLVIHGLAMYWGHPTRVKLEF
jgi:hypothetical protein